jgi:tetratricopeptide (TPR) repeat protein
MSRWENHYPRLGEQVTRLVRSLAAVKGWKMMRAMEHISQSTHYGPDMIHRWRQGKICPSPEIVEILAQMGKEEANLPREWGESLLRAAQHPDAGSIINNLWGSQNLRQIPCNLPSLEHRQLIGRQAEIIRLLELLSLQHVAHLITVDGIGGVGKTALVLEVAYRCWKVSTGEVFTAAASTPVFDAIIFVSAKQQYLTPDGIITSIEARRTMRNIFREISSTLNFEITRAAPQDYLALVRSTLARQRTLLVVDNFETVENKQEIMSFLYELPASVKVVITTRERVQIYSPIRLEQLDQEEALALIQKEAQDKETDVSKMQALSLYQHIGGIPVALIYAIGQLASGFSFETVLSRIPETSSDVARFCFEGSIGPLRGQRAHDLLMAIAMFPKSPLPGAVVDIAGLRGDLTGFETGITQLQKLSLIRQYEGRYRMLPLTREYALSELSIHTKYEQEARQRWVTWYLNFTKEYGGKDWKEWHIRYDRIEEEWENLLAIFEWCAVHEQYSAVQTFWQERQLVKFAHIYGHWDDRLTWLDWLIHAGERRGDWSNAIRAMVDKGSTLTLMGQLEDATKQLKKAWDMHEHANTWVQIILAEKIASLHTYQKQYVQALQWFERAKGLLESAQFDELENKRRWADLQTSLGFLYYKQRNYKNAEQCYKDALARALDVGWQRIAIVARIHLAYIAIAQNRFDEAETLLQTGLPVVDNNTDKRLTALYRQTFAQLYKELGRVDEARIWAKNALDGFERLEMKAEAEEVQSLLMEIDRREA